MRFLLLGSLAIVTERGQLPLGGPTQRAVLALLTLNANRVLPVDRIIDAVWDEAPPATAKTQVQAQISGLRRLLRRIDSEPACIHTHPAGYMLSLDPADIDCTVFERQVYEGLAFTSQELLSKARARLRGALRLWRGRPLGGVEARFARSEAVRLEELRLSALEQLVALDLQAGRGGNLISELTALVANYPLHERLRRHLMLALYRAQRGRTP
jgi:DNA-binding SARP family transcriptional activator